MDRQLPKQLSDESDGSLTATICCASAPELDLQRAQGADSARMLEHGKRVARSLGKGKILIFEIFSPIHLAASAWPLKSNDFYPWIWWVVFALCIQAYVTLLSKSHTEAEKQDKEAAEATLRAGKEAAEAQVRNILLRTKAQTAGNMAYLLKALVEDEQGRCAQLQKELLTHAVDVIKEHLGLPRHDERIAATWAVPDEKMASWQVAAYDRNQAHRQTGRVRPIADGIPGASEAFLTGNAVFIDDTLDERVRAHFDKMPPYRSILSIPARAIHVRDGCGNVRINGHPNAILGVLNIDCQATGVLREDVSSMVLDIAYIIAILEHLRGGR